MQQLIAKCYSQVNSNLHIGRNVARCYDSAMAGIKEIRRNNLQTLLKRYETQREFADEAGLSAAHVSQMVTGARVCRNK